MVDKQHGDMVPGDGADDTTRGVHVIQGFADVTDEAARAAITIAAGDLGRCIRQTAGLLPGWYLAKATGSGLDKWAEVLSPLFDVPGQTTDATTLTLLAYTTAVNNRSITMRGVVWGREPSTGERVKDVVEIFVDRDSGGTVTIDQVHHLIPPFRSAGASAWTFGYDVSGSDVRVRVTGEAGKTIEWRTRFEVIEHG